MSKSNSPVEPKKVTEIIVVREPSLAVSVLEDLFSFGGAILVMWFNHAALNGNGWIDLIFIIIIFMTVARFQTRRMHRFNTRSQAITFLKGRDYSN